MNLKELAKTYQDVLKEGSVHLIIWKEGRSWKAGELDVENGMLLDGDAEVVKVIKAGDPQAIIVNGQEHFARYTLAHIEYQIEKLHNEAGNFDLLTVEETEEAATEEVIAAIDEPAAAETTDNFTLMLYRRDTLLNGKVVNTLASYAPDNGDPTFDIVKVSIPVNEKLLLKDYDGIIMEASCIVNNSVVSWQPLQQGGF